MEDQFDKEAFRSAKVQYRLLSGTWLQLAVPLTVEHSYLQNVRSSDIECQCFISTGLDAQIHASGLPPAIAQRPGATSPCHPDQALASASHWSAQRMRI